MVWADIFGVPSYASLRHHDAIFLWIRKRRYTLKDPLLNSWKHIWRKIVVYISSYLRDFNLIKLLLKIKSIFFNQKIRSFLKVWAHKVDINLLNQHCKPAGWMAEWLTDWTDLLRHFVTQGIQGTWALEGHLDTRALMALGPLRQSGTRRALGHSRHSDIQKALGHSGTRDTQGTLFSRLSNIILSKIKYFLRYSNLNELTSVNFSV